MAQDKGKNILMAQDKGKSTVPAPPMNPPPRLSPIPFGERHGCDGDGCASDPGTWPLYDVILRGEHCRLCCSCVLLSHRSLYCCRCIFLVTSPSNYDNGDPLMAPPAPTVTCQVCREAVAHLPCLYAEPPADGVFVCPPCAAAQNGRRFTYATPTRQPVDERGARVIFLAGRMSLALLQRQAAAARAAAERKALEARDARARANEALSVAYDLAKKEDPSWVLPQSIENALAAFEEGESSQAVANVGELLLVRRNAMPPLPPALTIGAGASGVKMPPAKANHTAPSSSKSKPLFDLNEDAPEDEEEADQAEPTPHPALNSFNMKEKMAMAAAETARANPTLVVAMAATEAARAKPPMTQMLQLFPGAMASTSTITITKRPRTLKLFKDDRKA